MGIFIIRGKGVKRGVEIPLPHIMDIAPTVLYLFGIPIPSAMDGRVMLDVFEDDTLSQFSVCFDEERRESAHFEYGEKKAEISMLKTSATWTEFDWGTWRPSSRDKRLMTG
jgi:arylsulfatase A-like enzyme